MLIAVSSLAASCASPVSGNFCDVSEPAYIASDAVADYIHANDPALESFIIRHNRFGEESCNWSF